MARSQRTDDGEPSNLRILINVFLVGLGMVAVAAIVAAVVLIIGWEGVSALLFFLCLVLGIAFYTNQEEVRSRSARELASGRCPACQGTGLKGHGP